MPDHTLTQDPSPTHPMTVQLVGAPPAPPGYELREEVGRGGMGVVYRARDLALGREVAVKVLAANYPSGSGTASRFLDEARITAQLQHPGIPPVYQVGATPDGRPFLAMKLIRGLTLSDRLKTNESVDRLGVIEAVAQAVGYAHAQGVIHRDLKPANVMVGAFGEVQVMDWGVAKRLDDGRPERELTETPPPADGLTRAGSVVGTPAYMAPEQAAGVPGKVDRRSDVFGLGAVLCVLLTGKPPYVGEDALSAHELAARGDLTDAFARLEGCGADPDVVALCRRCLTADPAGRPADGTVVAAEIAGLRRAADERARQAERDKLGAEVQAAEWRKRRRVGLWVGGGLVAVLLTGVATTSIGLLEANVARRNAETATREADSERAAATAAQGEAERLRVAAETARTAEAGERKTAETRERETDAVFRFFIDRLVAVAQPQGTAGGLGRDVTLRNALFASLKAIPSSFAGQPMVEARVRQSLARAFNELGEPAVGVEQAALAHKLAVGVLGPDHPDTLEVLLDQAHGLHMSGRWADALTLRQQVADGMQKAVGPDHIRALRANATLAGSYQSAGRHDDCFRLMEDTVRRMTAVFGPDHQSTVMTVGQLADAYSEQGRSADAIRLGRETLAKLTAKLGPDDQVVLAVATNLAVTLRQAGKAAEAIPVYEDVLARRRRTLGPDHPSTLLVLHNLAPAYLKADRGADAVRAGEEVTTRRAAVHGPDNPLTLRSLTQLAEAYTAVGRHPDAVARWTEAVDRVTATQPPTSPELLTYTRGLVASLLKAGNTDEAQRRTDAALTRAGKTVRPVRVEKLLNAWEQHFTEAGDPAGCRSVAERWEALKLADGGDFFAAACYRASAARGFAAATQPAEEAVDADRAMAWLTKAVAAGFTNRREFEREAALSALRGRADYRALVAGLAERAPRPRPAK